MTVSPAKAEEPIVMPFGMLFTRVGLRNHVLDGSPDPHMWCSNFKDKSGPAQDMPGQSDSAGGGTGMVWVQMPTAMY